ncbi:hypothetical protein EYF80_030340 [Liparis tanakae]|uniref:Uncharacterized protein n=1 Tax=Liparis tanakae TaxID=230148 RepID=A0A4Z2H2A0_9TELE|nr:hypothetical protein EYF80_030340 [Liparis tanakae]
METEEGDGKNKAERGGKKSGASGSTTSQFFMRPPQHYKIPLLLSRCSSEALLDDEALLEVNL